MNSVWPVLLCSVLIALAGGAQGAQGDRCLSDQNTRTAMRIMDQRINAEGGDKALDAYLALFDPQVQAWGLYQDGAADLARIRTHYQPVFGNFKDSVLVSEESIVAGDMAAQRYHALFRLDGVFDGVEARDRLTAIRGQTFFHFNKKGLIAERWSNHDHSFRMAQLLGDRGMAEGARVARALNGPGLAEEGVYAALERWLTAFNLIHTPQQRSVETDALLAPELVADDAGLQEFRQQLATFWNAVPDAVLHYDTRLSAWSMGAVRWRIAGSLRSDYAEHKATGQPIWLRGESIIRFTTEGRIERIWNGCVDWGQGDSSEEE